MKRLYDRRVSVTVGDVRFSSDPGPDGEALILPGGRVARGLTISFKVTNSLESKSNDCEAQLVNLNADTRGAIASRRKQRFIIEAGYRDSIATIFDGDAVEVRTTRQATDVVTTVSAKDGFRLTRSRVSTSLPPGSSVGEAIQEVARSMGLAASSAVQRAKQGDFDGAVSTFFNGLTMSGTARDQMDELARTHGFDWSIQQGELLILNKSEVTPDEAVLLNSSTGLITSPERLTDEKRPKSLLVRGRSLLQPGIRPGRLVELESAEISGRFKVEKVTHTGDTSGQAFDSVFDGVEQ